MNYNYFINAAQLKAKHSSFSARKNDLFVNTVLGLSKTHL